MTTTTTKKTMPIRARMPPASSGPVDESGVAVLLVATGEEGADWEPFEASGEKKTRRRRGRFRRAARPRSTSGIYREGGGLVSIVRRSYAHHIRVIKKHITLSKNISRIRKRQSRRENRNTVHADVSELGRQPPRRVTRSRTSRM